ALAPVPGRAGVAAADPRADVVLLLAGLAHPAGVQAHAARRGLGILAHVAVVVPGFALVDRRRRQAVGGGDPRRGGRVRSRRAGDRLVLWPGRKHEIRQRRRPVHRLFDHAQAAGGLRRRARGQRLDLADFLAAAGGAGRAVLDRDLAAGGGAAIDGAAV